MMAADISIPIQFDVPDSLQLEALADEAGTYRLFRRLRVYFLCQRLQPALPFLVGEFVPKTAGTREYRFELKAGEGLLVFMAALRAGNDYRRVIRNFHGFASSGGGFDGCVEAPSYQPPEGAPA